MYEVTQILHAIDQGDPQAAERLLPLVYGELRKLAAQKIAQEKPGQTLQATALVHEAYVRLVDNSNPQSWDNRGHFFAAAAEAMRRILVERARCKATLKRGGDGERIDLDQVSMAALDRPSDLLALDEALAELEQHDPQAASLVKLRYFVGLTNQQAADALGISRGVANRRWTLARAWLYRQLS
jgi:RNA polymerase sigma factor (TIGR02999 family)